MSKYDIDELNRLWRLQRLSVEQALGQLSLHAQDTARKVPEQSEAIDRLRDRLHKVAWEVTQLARENR